MKKSDYVSRIAEIQWIFEGSSYDGKLKELIGLLNKERYDEIEVKIKEFPTVDAMLAELVKKLKGKPVAKSLNRLIKGKLHSNYDGLKSLFSLGTHICIECEKSPEYRALLFKIYERLGVFLQSV